MGVPTSEDEQGALDFLRALDPSRKDMVQYAEEVADDKAAQRKRSKLKVVEGGH
jgi:hypothetical protein